MRVLAPITPEKEREGFDTTFVPTLAGVRLTRYVVPYFLYVYADIPFDEDYRRLERAAIHDALPRLIEGEHPDLIVAGQEPLTWLVPEIAAHFDIPCAALLRGDPTWRIATGSFPQEEARPWLDAYASAQTCIAVAQYFEDGLRHLGLDNVCTISNHVDLKRFSPAPRPSDLVRELGVSDDDVVVLHASKIEPRKRPLDIITSATLALKKCPQLLYVIVGEGPMRETMEEACRESGLAHRFRFVGWSPYARMPAWFNLADVVVQPSEGEGIARVYLEAMACGKPVVASDIPAAREVIEHDRTGLLFRVGDTPELTANLLAAAQDSERRRRLGTAAQKYVQRHSLEFVAAEYEEAFHQSIRGYLQQAPR